MKLACMTTWMNGKFRKMKRGGYYGGGLVQNFPETFFCGYRKKTLNRLLATCPCIKTPMDWHWNGRRTNWWMVVAAKRMRQPLIEGFISILSTSSSPASAPVCVYNYWLPSLTLYSYSPRVFFSNEWRREPRDVTFHCADEHKTLYLSQQPATRSKQLALVQSGNAGNITDCAVQQTMAAVCCELSMILNRKCPDLYMYVDISIFWLTP